MSRCMPRSWCVLALAICSLFAFQVSSVSAAGNARVGTPKQVATVRGKTAPTPQKQAFFVEEKAAKPNPSQQYLKTGGEYYSGGCDSGNCGGDDCYGGDCGSSDCGVGGNCGGDCCGSSGCCGDCCGMGGCGGSCCGEQCGGDCCGVCDFCEPSCGYRQPKCAVWADWLYLQATDADVTHAQQQNGIGGAGTVPFGDIGSVDMEYESGIRIGGAIGCNDCSRVLFSWTNFETNAFADLGAPVIPGGGGAVGSLVHHPGASVTASTGPVTATNEIDYQVADVMFNRIVRSGKNYYIGFLAGAQYGHLEQRFNQLGQFGGGNGGVISTDTAIEFDGGGLKAGFDGESVIGCSGFSAYGRLTGAAMSGSFRSRYSMYNTTTDISLAQANWSDDRIVPNLEYELGMAWTSRKSRFRLSTGYMFTHWINTVTTPEFIDAVQENDYVDVGNTLSFDGFVTRAELRW